MTLLNVRAHVDTGLNPGRSGLEDHLETAFCAKKKGMMNYHIDDAGQVFIIRRQTKTGHKQDKASKASGEMRMVVWL